MDGGEPSPMSRRMVMLRGHVVAEKEMEGKVRRRKRRGRKWKRRDILDGRKVEMERVGESDKGLMSFSIWKGNGKRDKRIFVDF